MYGLSQLDMHVNVGWDCNGLTVFALFFTTEVEVHAWSRLSDQLWFYKHCLMPQKHHP